MAAHVECVARGKRILEIGDIVREHRDELERIHTLSLDQRRALSAMALCRTAALGGHLDVCTACGYERPSYNSCRNRHCPKCQALAQETWIAERLARVLPVRHFHVVFTLPAELRALGAYRSSALYELLFEAATRTLLEVGRGPKLGACLGVTAVLHTWTRELLFHPHLHCIVTSGGLDLDGARWKASRADYLLPVRVLAQVFRGKFLHALRRAYATGTFAGFSALSSIDDFEAFCERLSRKPWVVYAKKPFATIDHVFRYLGRYTHRIGIANSRLLDVGEHHVTFRTKCGRAITIAPVSFLARLVKHVLPKGFVKIRHYGLYAASNVGTKLETARRALGPARAAEEEDRDASTSFFDRMFAVTGRDLRRCPACEGELLMHPLPSESRARAPP